MLEKITISDFQPYLNQSLSIRFTSEVTQPARLTGITPWGSETDKFRQPFTLELETELTPNYYLQGIFVLIHPTIGELSLFMVPIGPGKNGMRYEIVIS
ncbi:MAG: hypothetical protein U0X91_25890 [Spirosomataceae bacterium]